MRVFLRGLALLVLLVPLSNPALSETADRERAPLVAMDNRPAPDFALKNLDGETVTLRQYRGRVVVVNFWATWCPPCRAEMPSMQRAWEVYKDKGIVLLGVDIGETDDRVFQFMADLGLDFPVVLDTDSKVTNAWPVKGLPTTVVVDPKGRMAFRAIGARKWDDAGIIKQLMGLF